MSDVSRERRTVYGLLDLRNLRNISSFTLVSGMHACCCMCTDTPTHRVWHRDAHPSFQMGYYHAMKTFKLLTDDRYIIIIIIIIIIPIPSNNGRVWSYYECLIYIVSLLRLLDCLIYNLGMMPRQEPQAGFGTASYVYILSLVVLSHSIIISC